MRSGLWTSTLAYGPPNAGKTALGVSAFWDWKTRTLLGDGKYIGFGREDNPALRIPEECRQLSSGASLRLTAPDLRSDKFITDFGKIVDAIMAAARRGQYLDALVIDGMSEFDLLFEAVYDNKNAGADKWDKWDALMSEMFAMMQRLDPIELRCDIIMTARVMERKKATVSKSGRSTRGDPSYINFDYYPSLRGSFRLHFPHYFNLVLYLETDMRLHAGLNRKVPAHILNMVRTGDYFVKNQWEYEWLLAGYPSYLLNTSFPAMKALLEQAAAREVQAADNLIQFGVNTAIEEEKEEKVANDSEP